MRAIAQDSKVNNQIKFLGSIPYSRMAQYYAQADVVISIPQSDGMPQTLFEAMACEVFLIVSDLPQYDEFLKHGKTGLRVGLMQENSLVDAMLWVLNHPDEVQFGKKTARKYVLKNANKAFESQKLLAIYSEILD